MKNQKGFTLVEIIVTIVILSVLMAIAVPISLSFMDDIHEQRLLSEGKSILSVAQGRVNRMSLEGQFVYEITAENEYNLPSDKRKEIVEKANGKGALHELIYYNGKVTGMRYYIENKFVVLKKGNTELEIDKDASPNDIAYILSDSQVMGELKTYFGRSDMKDGSCVDSKAPSNSTNPGLAGIGDKIRVFLVNMGVNIDNVSWTFIRRDVAGTNKRNFELIIYDGDINKVGEIGKTVEVSVVSYMFSDNGILDESKDKFAVEKKATVARHPDDDSKYNYLVLRP